MHTQTIILRLPAVKARTGKSRSAIYAEIQKQLFPRPVVLSARPGARAVGWLEHEIDAWLEARVKASHSVAK